MHKRRGAESDEHYQTIIDICDTLNLKTPKYSGNKGIYIPDAISKDTDYEVHFTLSNANLFKTKTSKPAWHNGRKKALVVVLGNDAGNTFDKIFIRFGNTLHILKP